MTSTHCGVFDPRAVPQCFLQEWGKRMFETCRDTNTTDALRCRRTASVWRNTSLFTQETEQGNGGFVNNLVNPRSTLFDILGQKKEETFKVLR